MFNYFITIEQVVVIRNKSDLSIRGANLVGHNMFGEYSIVGCINKDYIEFLTLYARHESTSEDDECIYSTFSDLGVVK